MLRRTVMALLLLAGVGDRVEAVEGRGDQCGRLVSLHCAAREELPHPGEFSQIASLGQTRDEGRYLLR